MNLRYILIGIGSTIPRLGGPYTVTIHAIEIWDVDKPGGKPVEIADDSQAGWERQREILGQRKVEWDNPDFTNHHYTHTFLKVTALADLYYSQQKCKIQINGISPRSNGYGIKGNVEAEIEYPRDYSS